MCWQKRGVSSICGDSVYCVVLRLMSGFVQQCWIVLLRGICILCGFCVVVCIFALLRSFLFWCVVLRRWWILLCRTVFVLMCGSASRCGSCTVEQFVLLCGSTSLYGFLHYWTVLFKYVTLCHDTDFVLPSSFLLCASSVSLVGFCATEQFCSVVVLCRCVDFVLLNSFCSAVWICVAMWNFRWWAVLVLRCGSESLCGLCWRAGFGMQSHGLCCKLTRWICVKRMPVAISVFFSGFSWRLPPSKKVVQPHINKKRVGLSRGFSPWALVSSDA